jgi:hypothetical protein
MFSIAKFAKVFQFIFLIFVSFTFLNAQPPSIDQVPAGTHLWLKADVPVDSKFSSANDTFIAKLSRPLVIRDVIVIDAGTKIEGRVVSSKEAGFAGRNGKLVVIFETIFFDKNEIRAIRGELLNELDADSSQMINIAAIGGSTVTGAIIGLSTHSKSGGFIGAGIGAGGGIGFALLRKGKNVGIEKGEEFEIRLMQDLNIPLTDF